MLELQGRDPDLDNPRYPAALADMTQEDFRRLGETYLADTRVYRTDKPYFIDKMPNNFRHIGLIHLMLPNARIIDARREPMACCFSNLKQLFAQGQEFTYSVEDIARYYRTYLDLMRHWDEVLPGRILRVQHEDVVADLEGSVRRMLDYCGLPFEPACVDVPQDQAQRAHAQLRAGAPAHLPRRPGSVEQIRTLAGPLEDRAGGRADSISGATVTNDELLALYGGRGAAAYFGEAVTVTEHSLQSSYFAQCADAPDGLVIAALLHDIGHLIEPVPGDIADWKMDARHEMIGSRWLALRFGLEVSEHVRLHVPAKRYLCTADPDYFGALSLASVVTLRLQGGPMSPGEAEAFAAEPYFRDAVRLRQWDDQSKIAGFSTPDFAHYRSLIERLTATPGGRIDEPR